MTLRNILLQNSAFTFQNNIFYQRDFQGSGTFEKLYLSLREKENRIYPDALVKMLPAIPRDHSLRKEWMVRKFTVQRLIPYLKKKNHPKILELGCGNGWLCNHLARLPGSEVLGMDVNERELLQGSRVFAESKNISFAHADISTASLRYDQFDYIILSASIQYFRDIDILLERLLSMLADNGEIHIVDSPVYNEGDVSSAHNRSEEYFSAIDFPLMKQHYHHHSWQSLRAFHVKMLYDPKTFLNRVNRRFFGASPFPWIKIIAKERGSRA